ncbi:MAG: flagellar basal body L-ring protein FlgH, partial [Pseudomonadota bacterium]
MAYPLKPLAALAALALLPACGTIDRIAEIGKAPDLTPIGDVNVVTQQTSISQPVTLQNQAAMRAQQTVAVQQKQKPQDASLWRTGARAFFSDQRANQVGDILTVNINISDNAAVDNSTSRSRTSTDEAGVTNFLGFESELNSFLPNAVNPG